MKLVERIDTQEQVEKLTAEQREDFFTNLIMGKDVTEEVKTSRGVFTVKYPKTKDIITIGKIAAFRRSYKPIEGFDVETEMVNMMAATLDVVVVSGPKWFEDAKQRDSNFSFLEAPSRGFLVELYGKAYSFRENVERRLSKAEGPADKRLSSKKGDDGAVDGGAFGSLTNEPEVPKP